MFAESPPKSARSALALFAVAAAAVWFVTRPPGPALSPDSASYLYAAESLASGHGLRVPFAEWWSAESTERLSHFPPGFPGLIALPVILGASPPDGARAIEALACGVTAVIAFLAAAAAARSVGAGILSGVLFLVTPAIAQVFVPVLSEPLFLTLVAALVYTMMRTPGRAGRLGVIAAAGVLVRYAGVALGAAAVVWSLSVPGSLVVRARRAALAGLPTLLAVSAWRRYSGDFRTYGVFSKGFGGALAQAWGTVAAWIVPWVPGGVVRTTMAGAALVGVAAVVRRALRAARPGGVEALPPAPELVRLLAASATFSASYLGLLVFSRLFADRDLELDWRALCPVFLVSAMAFAASIAVALPASAPSSRTLAFTLLGSWVLASAAGVAKLGLDVRRTGYGYEIPSWQASELAAWLRTEGAQRDLYSNHPAAVWHLTHRPSRLLPRRSDPETVRGFAQALRRAPSAVVALGNSFEDTLDPGALAPELGLGPPRPFDRGTVWTVDPPAH